MKAQRKFYPAILYLAALVFAGCLLASPAARAQCSGPVAGNNAIYCGSPAQIQPSTAYVDASAVPLDTDFCKTLNDIIVANTNVVIDARGWTSPITCGAGNTPWVLGVGSTPTVTSHAATILLPPGTLTIATTWIIPGSSRVIGEGPGVTTIKAATGFAADGLDSIAAVLEMGSQNKTSTPTVCNVNGASNVDCVGVGVQDLTVDMSSLSSALYGIYNAASQETSFVDNVTFINVGNASAGNYAALKVATVSGPSASNSGPYSNLVCTLTATANNAARCVDLQGHTRGIHGMSCYGGGTSAQMAAIYLDSDANSIEDVYINGFANGIFVGSQGQAPSNILFNITGGPLVSTLINVDNTTSGSTVSFCPPNVMTGPNVCDLTIMGVGAATGTTTIEDQITGTNLTVTGGDGSVGLYMLGEQLGSSTPAQYSRFSTSPRVPTWLFGSGVASGTCTPNGSLYSNTSTTGSTLFACINSTWTSIP